MNPESDRNEEDRPSYADLVKPPPYPMDEALEQACAPPPQNPGHTPDNWDEPQRAGQIIESETSTDHENSAERDGQSGGTGAAGRRKGGGRAEKGSAQGNSDGASGLVVERPPGSHESQELPQSVAESLSTLRPWQTRYVLSLIRLGGIQTLACQDCGVSIFNIRKYVSESPDFAHACAVAVEHSNQMVEAALYRGATIGDQKPVWHQGVLVGYERKRSHKDAELLLKLRGKLAQGSVVAEQIQRRQNEIPVAQAAELIGDIVSALTSGHRGRPEPEPIDAEEV